MAPNDSFSQLVSHNGSQTRYKLYDMIKFKLRHNNISPKKSPSIKDTKQSPATSPTAEQILEEAITFDHLKKLIPQMSTEQTTEMDSLDDSFEDYFAKWQEQRQISQVNKVIEQRGYGQFKLNYSSQYTNVYQVINNNSVMKSKVERKSDNECSWPKPIGCSNLNDWRCE